MSDAWNGLLAAPADERIYYLYEQVYWELPRHKEIVEVMEWRFSLPPSDRPRSVVITGESGMGKTSVLREMLARHPAKRDKESGQLLKPVLYFEMPLLPGPERLIEEALSKAGYPVEARNTATLCDYFERQVPAVEPCLVLVDEAQRANHVTPRGAGRQCFEVLKWFGMVLQCPVVVAGTGEIMEHFKRDNQLGRRFQHFDMPLWKTGKPLASYMQAIMANMPLRDGYESIICDSEDFLDAYLKKTDRTTGGILSRAQDTVRQALKAGREYLSAADLLKD